MNGHSPRRFLFSTAAGSGHFHPLVPLAHVLAQRGHEVAFAARPRLQQQVEAAGFPFILIEGNRENDPEYQQLAARLQAMPVSLETELFAYPRLFCGVSSRIHTPGMVQIMQQWRPDAVIRDAAQYSAMIAAEYLLIPHAVVAFAATLKTMPAFEQHAAEYLDPVRQSLSLPPDPELKEPYRYLYLAYSPPRFAMQDVGRYGVAGDIPATTHFIRPHIFDSSGTEKLPDWVAGLPDQPTVYVTLGTEVNSEPELYPRVMQTLIAGLRDAPINLIVTLGRDKDPADFGPQPANVHIERYIPQSLLLPHCDLMVMHGGSNTLLAAFDTDMPTVVVPLIADQFFNAQAMQRMQLAAVVQREQLTPASIRAAVDEVLGNPIYKQNVAKVKAEMHALPNQQYAADLVERLAVERQPILNPNLLARTDITS